MKERSRPGERRTMVRTIWPVVAALGLAGCGGSATSDGNGATATSESETTVTTTAAAPSSSDATVITTTTTAATTVTTTPATPTTAARTETTMSTTPPPTDPPESAPPADSPTGGIVDSAIADLRDRLGDPDAEIEVVSVEEVDWPDGSLGCPQPGMMYTQAIVNGSKIVLSHAGVLYPYHQGGSRAPFLCETSPAKDRPGTGTLAPPPGDLDT